MQKLENICSLPGVGPWANAHPSLADTGGRWVPRPPGVLPAQVSRRPGCIEGFQTPIHGMVTKVGSEVSMVGREFNFNTWPYSAIVHLAFL